MHTDSENNNRDNSSMVGMGDTMDAESDTTGVEGNKLDNLGSKLARDEKGRLLPNQSSLNPLGRPKGQTLKEYKAKKFREMSDEDKEEWLKTHNVSGDIQWRMAEGNPKQDNTTEITVPDNLIELIKHGTANKGGDSKLPE